MGSSSEDCKCLGGGFQSPCECYTLEGSIGYTCVVDPECPPSNIVKAGTAFQIVVNWEIHGTVVDLMCGTFGVQAFFEGIGKAADEADYPAAPIPVPLVHPNNPYKQVIDVPGNLLKPGAYNVVVLITFTNAAGNPGPIAGMSDEKLIQIFP